MTRTLHDIANQLDRLHNGTDHVDRAPAGNGQQSAGYSGCHDNSPQSIGWYCDGGNAGEMLFSIPAEEIDGAFVRLAAAAPGDGTAEAMIRQYQ